MSLYFRNLFPKTVYIAFLYYDPGCGGTPFRKQGWWAVPSGQTLNLWDTDLRRVGRYAAFYAEEFKDSGGAAWSGTGNNWYLIPDGVFDQCYDDNANCNQRPDFVQLDFNGYCNVTVVLGPAAGQLSTQYAQCGPVLTATPRSQPANFYTTFYWSGTGFPTGITVYMYLVGMKGHPNDSIGAGFSNVDANGNISGGFSFLCQNPEPSPDVVLQALDGSNNNLLASTLISFGCSY